MGDIAELSREFDERLAAGDGPSEKPADTTETTQTQAQAQAQAQAQEPTTLPPGFNDEPTTITTSSTAPALPPHMIPYATQPTSTLLSAISETPLFMTSLPAATSESNPGLEALQALAYEGAPWEVAQNFREQGNECFRAKRWGDAREFYGKALGVLRVGKGEGGARGRGEEEEKEERRKEREVEEICLVNRAACNLELKNYRQTTLDCTQALALNPTNPKAHYRLSLAHYQLNHLPTALSTTNHALTLSPASPALLALRQTIQAAQSRLAAQESARLSRAAAQRSAAQKLQTVLQSRGIAVRRTAVRPLLPDPDARITLRDGGSGGGGDVLCFPALVLYPLALQSDFVCALAEDEALAARLAEMLPPPWDVAGEYSAEGVECYMETAAGGLVKVGKNVAVGKVLAGGKVEVVDEVVRILVVPRGKAAGWVEEFKEEKRRMK